MSLTTIRWLAAGGIIILTAARGAAQTVPAGGMSQEALQQALLQNPALADLIRSRIQSSGLTPDQLHARLEASGYAPNMLDSYMGSGGSAEAPGAAQLAAVEALGIPLEGSIPLDTGIVRTPPSAPSPVFGIDVFRHSTTQFLPSLAGPVPADYKIGPGDVLVLILTGNVQLAYTLAVTRYGFALIPQVGQVYVANLTLDQVRDVLYTRLGQVYSGVRRGSDATTRFDVFLSSTRANQIYVIGEVVQPGAYRIGALGTVLTALYVAGGVTERGNTRRVQVRRQGQTVATFDLYDYLLEGDTRNDLRLEDGDLVFVPVHGTRVQVAGAVRRPGYYELKTGETLADLVRVAAGFRAFAALDRLTIHRILPASARGPGPSNRAALDVALSAGPDGGAAVPPVPLEDGDSIAVDSLPRLEDSYYVAVAGMVNKPGIYPWRPGMTLRQLVQLGRGPKVGADLSDAEIARLPANRAPGQLANTVRVPLDSTYLLDRDSLGRYTGPAGAPVPKDGTPEIPLEPYDNVLILKQPAFEYQWQVVIAGEVHSPGVYSLRSKEERVADVVDRAGGLTAQAYPEGIRFIRTAGQVGRVNVDLSAALRDRKSGANLVLQSGDSIVIPLYQPSVQVSGAVNSPRSVLWKRGADLDYYISAAGGVTDKAEQGQTSVVYANGEVRTRHHSWLVTSKPQPGPGSEVVVPARTVPPGLSTAPAIWAAVTQVIASLVAITALLKK